MPGVRRWSCLRRGCINSAYFEHSFLARQMGVELVEGRDLTCREDVVYMRTTEGERRVDVVYRRVDDEFLDPLHFRSDSVVGCPGILNAARAGNVTLANAVGNGVADDKLAYTYVPDMITYYLGESPILPNVETYRLEDPDQLAHVLAHLDQLVLKPVAGSGGYGILMGPHASDEELEQARSAVEARTPPVDRPGDGEAVDRSDQRGRTARPAPPRPPSLRRQRRERYLGGPRRPDPSGAPRRGPDGQLQPGRRVQGHLGALRWCAGRRRLSRCGP